MKRTAPVSALDPREVQATLAQLLAAEQKRQNVDPTLAARLVMDQLSVTSFYKKLDAEDALHAGRRSRGAPGLVEAGLETLLDWMP